MPDPTIRPATPDDLSAITAIYRDEVENGVATFELAPPDLAEMTARMARLLDGGFPYLAAEIDGAVAGYAYAGPFHARPAYRWTVEDSIYLARTARGRGVGRLLLSALIDEATGRGYRQMVAVISRAEPDISVRLHAAAGFALVGTLPAVGFKFGRWRDVVTMSRPLGEGDTTPPT